MMIKYCQCHVLCENIRIIALTSDVPNDQQPLVLQLPQEVIAHVHMACPASNTPTIGYVNSPRVVHVYRISRSSGSRGV